MAGNSIEAFGNFINGIQSKIVGGPTKSDTDVPINIGGTSASPTCPELPSLDEIADSANMFDEIINEKSDQSNVKIVADIHTANVTDEMIEPNVICHKSTPMLCFGRKRPQKFHHTIDILPYFQINSTGFG